METGFAILTLAVTGFLLCIIHIIRRTEQQRKAEIVPVKVKTDPHLEHCLNKPDKADYEQYHTKRLDCLVR